MARPRKYATVDELGEVESRLTEKLALSTAELAKRIKESSPNGELTRIAAKVDRFDRIIEPVEEIVKERAERITHERAWATVKADLRHRLHIPKLESTGERLSAAIIGGIGFTVAGKIGELTGLWNAVGEAAHHIVH